MMNILLMVFAILGLLSAVFLVCLRFLVTFNQIVSSGLAEFAIRGFLHFSVVVGAVAFAILMLLQLRDRTTPGRPADDEQPSRFITQIFFRSLVAAIIAAAYLGLVWMFLRYV